MDPNDDDSSSDEDEGVSDSATTHDAVKSTAVVKYSAVETPAAFALLQCNTDLNLPPANWLSSSAESYGLQCVLSSSTGFSSFRMADLFPDCVGEVDVVSDAENIKKLLKLPYSRGPVSMLVHRIKTTLLIDDFDIQKFLFKSAEVDWLSLKNFLQEYVFESLENRKMCITDQSKRRNVLQQENLVSKFLYHSLGHLEKKEPEERETAKSQCSEDASSSKFPPLPEPNIGEELPPDSEHRFVRNVVWTFENIQMLLGTDMPIFGGGTHPCVSLRLRDMSKPISVLTGIDYWLDNLMCNVPEVAMCFHIDGFVKKYELVKTEDLPYMEDSKFSPVLIRDVAKHILAFLKSNATKAGHTYWLLKEKDDDVVKLYDLTSICSSSMVDNSQNPFTIPVALLLYRVARNMKHSPCKESPSNPGTVRMLLKNCIRLLPKEKYPQIIASAHYMFSDSLIPLNTDPISPNLEDVYEKFINGNHRKNLISENQEKSNEDDDRVKTLCLSKKPPPAPQNSTDIKFDEDEFEIMQDIEKRCKIALEHIADGLDCLKYFDTSDASSSKKRSQKEEELNMAHPSTPIPMPYDPIKKENVEKMKNKEPEPIQSKKKKKNTRKKEEECQSIGALLCKSHIETLPTWQNPPDSNDNKAWQKHLKILLYEKACLVYASLAEREYSNESYGLALRHIHLVLESRAHLTNGACENILMSYLLGRAGDCCFQIARKWHAVEKFRAEFTHIETFDKKMIAVMKEEEVSNYKEIEFLPTEIGTLDNILNCSWMCYSKALYLENRDSERDKLQRRVGNICNELGSYFIRIAKEARIDENYTKEKMEALFAISMTHLENGIRAFKGVDDNGNLALLYSNTGNLMRLMAHFYSEDGATLNKSARSFYTKAQSNYQLALAALGSRPLNPEIWDTVFYELSTTLYTMAKLLQDFSPQNALVNKSELEREVSEYLSKALKYCDMDTPGPKQPLYQYRAADIHHRLASLYHKTYRDLDKESARRSKIFQLCLLNYEKAVKLYLMLELPAQFLRAQLEKVALFEFIAENSNGPAGKIKSLQNALDLMLQTAPILKIMSERGPSELSENREHEKLTNKNYCDTKSEKKTNDCVSNGNLELENRTEDIHSDENNSENEDTKDEAAEEEKMLNLLESRLQFILKSLIKLCSSSQKHGIFVSKYKDIYSALLQSSKNKDSIEQRLFNIVTQYSLESV